MNLNRPYILTAVLACFSLMFSGCSNREIKELQSSVSTLENRVVDYQLQTSKDSEETVSKVSEVNQSINKAFRDIRYTQSNLETLVEQLSTRLSKVERDVASLQQNTNQINTFSNDSYASLTERFTDLERTYKTQRQQDLEAIQKNLDSLSSELAKLGARQNSAQQSIQSLERQISAMSEDNRKIYRQILEELGAKVPDNLSQPVGSAEDSGQVHEVQRGETLGAISSKYGVSVGAIQQLNGIEDPSKIQVGQKIKIPK